MEEKIGIKELNPKTIFGYYNALTNLLPQLYLLIPKPSTSYKLYWAFIGLEKRGNKK